MPSKTSGKSRKSAPKSPSEFAPQVFVGGWDDAVKFEGAKFCVLDAKPDDMPPATHIPIYNESVDRADPKNLDRLVDGMTAAHAKGQPVLVFCGHGMYRSPLGAAWYLHRTEGISLEEAYVRVQSVRPKAKPAAGWVGNYAELTRA